MHCLTLINTCNPRAFVQGLRGPDAAAFGEDAALAGWTDAAAHACIALVECM